MPAQTDWPEGRLFGGAIARHLVPAVVTFVVGLGVTLVLAPVPSVLRVAVAGVTMAGLHLGCGLALRLPVARALTSQLSRVAPARAQRSHDTTHADAGTEPDESPTDDNEGS